MKTISVVIILLSNILTYSQIDHKRIELAGKLLKIMNYDVLMESALNEFTQIELLKTPELDDYKDVLGNYLLSLLNSDSVKMEFCKIYAEEFSENELIEISNFYETEIGKKAIKKMPQLMSRGMKLGQDLVLGKQEELKKIIMARRNELSLKGIDEIEFEYKFANDSSFSLLVPKKWNHNLVLSEDAAIQGGDQFDEMYFMVITVYKEDTDSVTFESLYKAMFDNFLTTVENFELLDSSTTYHNNFIKKTIEFRSEEDGLDITYYYALLEDSGKYYNFFNWTLSENYDRNKKFFVKIVDSIKQNY